MKNDLAFMLETNIYLYEHQSTLNPNIPLRDLIYIGIEYQQYVDDKSLYSSRLQKIPAPKFILPFGVFSLPTLYHIAKYSPSLPPNDSSEEIPPKFLL